MLYFFERKGICEIELHNSVTQDDREHLELLLDKNYVAFKITFALLYTVPREVTLLLYRALKEQRKDITLITYRSKLNRYFHRLGFQSSFISQLGYELTNMKQEKLYSYEIQLLTSYKSDEELLRYLFSEIEKRYGYNFTHYKEDMLHRRFSLFKIKHSIKNSNDAVALILLRRVAFLSFFLDLSINVTEFFRNPYSYRELSSLLEAKYRYTKRLKIWSAGCSSGKEAYSIAMILDSINMLQKTLIYATDFNKFVLEDAKAALYSLAAYKRAIENAKKIGFENYIKNYIVKNDSFMYVKQHIVKNLLFLDHNLTKDSSFNEFDIIMCRNVLIYFEDNLQKKVFSLLYESLRFGGYLFLGESEILHSDFREKFVEYDLKYKIYKKVA